MSKGGGRRGGMYFLVLALATCGVIAIAVAIMSQRSAPQPSAAAAGTISSNEPTTSPSAHPGVSPGGTPSQPSRTRSEPSKPGNTEVPLGASLPTTIEIPAIGVRSDVVSIGKAADGSLAVPQPGPDLNKAAWYENSPTPGQLGPSVIEGHIDSVNGPSVFFDLGALRPQDTIRITRADHSVAVFTVNAVRAYALKSQFPTAAVYGADLGHATLRLITCSNFDESIGHYLGNTVVFAHLTDVRHLARTS